MSYETDQDRAREFVDRYLPPVGVAQDAYFRRLMQDRLEILLRDTARSAVSKARRERKRKR